MEQITRLAREFRKEDFYLYADAEKLPSGRGPYIWSNDDEIGTQVILSGCDDGITIQVFFIIDNKDNCYGIIRDFDDSYSSIEEMEDIFVSIYNKFIDRIVIGQPVEKTCKLMNMHRLI